jgi:cyclase
MSSGGIRTDAMTTTLTRRDLLRFGGLLGGAAVLGRHVPSLLAQAPAAVPTDPLEAMRAQMGATPIKSASLADGIVMLSGPGGNVVVQTGADGKVVVDSFVLPAWPKLKALLDSMGMPLKLLIDTHWHFDHTDNNANFHKAGADILAHDNTRKRLNEPHDLLGMHFEPVTPSARPTATFRTTHTVEANGEFIELGYFAPAHTDTDIYVRFPKAKVLHMGDVFFNGVYPFIDVSTGGNIGGMIAGANKGLELADDQTKVVPGHGPLGDKAALTAYRDMMVTVRDRVQTLRTAKKPLAEVIAAKPTADLDARWAKGMMQPDAFVTIVYNTL